jgi:hypothetical protein
VPRTWLRSFVEKFRCIWQTAGMKLTNLLALLPGAVLLAGCKKLKPLPRRRPMMIRFGGILYKFGGCGVYPLKAFQ